MSLSSWIEALVPGRQERYSIETDSQLQLEMPSILIGVDNASYYVSTIIERPEQFLLLNQVG